MRRGGSEESAKAKGERERCERSRRIGEERDDSARRKKGEELIMKLKCRTGAWRWKKSMVDPNLRRIQHAQRQRKAQSLASSQTSS